MIEPWDANQEDLDSCSASFDPVHWESDYTIAANAEFVIAHPITRPLDEWTKIMQPMTKDDVLDTILFIRALP